MEKLLYTYWDLLYFVYVLKTEAELEYCKMSKACFIYNLIEFHFTAMNSFKIVLGTFLLYRFIGNVQKIISIY